MKLKLEHLAAYLPYGLKWADTDGYTGEMVQLSTANEILLHTPDGLTRIDISKHHHAKPLLRPLSDLTREIEVDGERFVPLEKLTKIFRGRPLEFDGMAFYFTVKESVVRGPMHTEVPSHFSQLHAFNIVHSWHFDTQNLIQYGLAIDLNSINQ